MLCAILCLVGLAAPAAGEEVYERRARAAAAALAAGRLDAAEVGYRELTLLYPQRTEPYAGLAEVLAARGRRGEAVDLLLELGRELLKVAREDEAVAPLERAVELAPEHAGARSLLGRTLGEKRRYRDAAATLERAVELGATDLETLLVLAASLWETGRWDAAEDVYRRALALHGDAFAALSHYGQLLLWQGRAAAAVAPLERAAAQRPDDARVAGFLARARSEAERPRPPAAAAEQGAGGALLTPAAADAGLVFRHDPGVTARRHLPETMGAGLAWLDYDGDGRPDLYLVQSGPFPPEGSPAAANRLFRNLGGGRFEDVTERAGAGDRGYGQGATAADVDGDGDGDLYVTNYGPDVLLENRGDGTFAPAAGVGVDGWSSSAAFADAEGDGDLDLYVTRYVGYDPDHGYDCGDEAGPDYCNVIFFPGDDDVFLRQGGDGTFEDATLAAGFEQIGGRGLGVVFTDLDGDGRPDVYVANDLDPNRLFRNLGGGRFEDVSLTSGAAYGRAGKAEASMGIAVGDVDGDGRPDLAVTNFDVELNALYRNLGASLFADVAAASGFGLPSFNLLGFGVVLADLDGDGDLDAFVANGHVFERPTRDTVARAQPPLLLLGDGRGRFAEQHLEAPAGLGRGAAAADYDGDGDVDVAVQQRGGAPELWRNDSSVVRWLGVELRGRRRNTQAVGARVTLVSGHRRQTRWLLAGESYQSSGDRRPLFAWPAGEEVRELEVAWPSGRRTRIVRPPAGRYLRIVE